MDAESAGRLVVGPTENTLTKAVARFLRRIVPSTSLLSHNCAFKCLVNSVDIVPKLFWPEFRYLPPNHLRIRVGVGNRFFSNQVSYLRAAESFWLYCLAADLITLDSTIVDIGSGCGRFAHHLRDFRFKDSIFRGRYVGVDVDSEMLAWCSKHFDAPRFRFVHSTHANKSYNQTGLNSKYVLPLESGAADFVFSTSLFTHLLEPELKNYYEESLRVLRPGGYMCMSCFCLDYPPPTFGGRHTFRHSIGNARVESLSVPEAAVAYGEGYMVSLASETGFANARVIGLKGFGDWQSILLAQKGTS